MKKLVWVLIFSLLPITFASAAPADIGIVLMHGKWGTPKSPGITVVANAATDQGYAVELLQMPWSRSRMYDKDYTEALAEISAAVAKLKANGAKKVILAGHSFGANAAMAYASQHDGVNGILLMAPGHSPDYQVSFFGPDVAKAKAMIAEGKGDETLSFEDSNQGKMKTIEAKARIYYSYFDPSGLGAMSVTAAKVRPGTAVLLIIGNSDPWFERARSTVFNKTPHNPQSRYIEINSNHVNTPKDGLHEIMAWLTTFE